MDAGKPSARNRTPQGVRYRAARDAAGLSRRDVGNAVKVDHSTVQRWEYGELQPRADQLVALAALYRTTVAALIGETDAAPSTGTEG